MPKGMYKSGTLRQKQVRTPGKTVVTHYEQRAPKQARCAQTGEVLHGVPRKLPVGMQRLNISRKRPSRPFGGFLGSRAMRLVLKYEAREQMDPRE